MRIEVNDMISLDYGVKGLEVKLNPEWNLTVFHPKAQRVIDKPIEAIREAINHPIGIPSLNKILANKKKIEKICIVVSDSTRPAPTRIMLEALFKELNEYGIDRDKIFILIATGLHRASRPEELTRMLGERILKECVVIDHVATDRNSLTYLGKASNGIPIYINKKYIESDVKILTGYVEPHFFFGFSGGRKSIVPGIAGEETIQANHSAVNIASPKARFGIINGNPLHENAMEIMKKVSVDFIINTCINEKHEITQIAAGDCEKAHQQLVNYQLDHVFEQIKKPFDIVICGNGGYPLDLNLYQAVKSMAIGEMAVKEGGTIISVNELSDGVGHDNFKELLFSGKTPNTIHEQIVENVIHITDQWEIQILTRILMKADIYVISRLKKEDIGNIGLKHAATVEKALDESIKIHGKNARILILPNGPSVLPLLNSKI